MSFTFLLIGVCLLADVCIGQSITPSPTGTFYLDSIPLKRQCLISSASCDYCYLAPGYTYVSSSREEYLLCTAYSMTSAFAQDGLCTTVSGASTPLQAPYSILKPATATADPTQYSSAVATWFVDHLNVPDWGICGENGSLAVHMANSQTTAFVDVAVPTILGAVSKSSPTTTATLVVTQSSLPMTGSAGLSATSKAIIGVVVAVVVLTLVILGLLLWFKYRQQRKAMVEKGIEGKLETETETGTEIS